MQDVSLDDKYDLSRHRAFLTGTQALVRLPMVQMRRDRAAGLNTGCFISGYRGSPLGGYDQQLERARRQLDAHGIVFRPGVNEDLAAAAVWGSQQLHLSPGARRDGVVGIWYGKGPGVDRSGDVLKHANAAGSSKHGGVLCLAGDDHGAKSSTVPHQSDHAFISAVIPVLYPSSIHEFIEMGLFGIAMSRYSGCWVAMKLVSESIETTAAMDLVGEDRQFHLPTDFELPTDGVNLRWPDDRWSQDARLQKVKGYAAIAFGRANCIDRVTLDSANARFGIIASGKAYEDVRQVLNELGIDKAAAEAIGLRLYKVGMPWPLEPVGIRHFSVHLEELLIVEERREIIEHQVKQELFNWRADVRPRVVGKFDEDDKPFLSLSDELSVAGAAQKIATRLLQFDMPSDLRARIEERRQWFALREAAQRAYRAPIIRMPIYCSGCPHNTSTRVPEGSRALAGIGCHFMAQWMDRNTETFSHMGGEGIAWTGLAPFTDEKHVFVNLGEGTYFHSGHLAIRQAVAAKVNVTYKILYNDAVAMTGGQHVDGDLSPAQITHQVYHEGVEAIVLLSDAPDAYTPSELAPGTQIRHRDDIDAVMQDLRGTPGCSVMVYVQTCAAEKRRRRHRGTLDDPPKRVFINAAVCEGCGDCSVQSNCVSVQPLETAFGRKRRIDQSSCNKDYSCLKGFCPSFVTVHGGTLRKAPPVAVDFEALPQPSTPRALDEPFNIAVTGVGGTGVLTVGGILGMAAYLEDKAVIILDMAGLAQKGGAVLSHVRIGARAADLTHPRIVTGAADLLLAADDVVAASKEGVELCAPQRTLGVVNTHLTPVGDFVRQRDMDFRQGAVADAVRATLRAESGFLDFTAMAEAALGDEIAANMMMLGYACQRGFLPLSAAAIERAITINGVAIDANRQAFAWGRLAAADPDRVAALLASRTHDERPVAALSLDALIAHRKQFLTKYQDARLADKYAARVAQARRAAAAAGVGDAIPRAVALNYAKLLAYKDEYEVARLFADDDFRRAIAAQFDGDYTLNFHLAPPFLQGEDASGRPLKRRFGPWMMTGFRALAKLRRLRGTLFDPFGYTRERRVERSLIAEYEQRLETILDKLQPWNAEIAESILSLPDAIRGYGPVKAASIVAAQQRGADLMRRFAAAQPPALMAAE